MRAMREEAAQGATRYQSVAIALPVVLAMWLAVKKSGRGAPVGVATALGIVAGAAVAAIVIDGARGSRSNILWTAFWVAGIVHLRLRRFRAAELVGMSAAALLFLYIGSFYKSLGDRLFAAVQQGATRAELEVSTGRTIELLAVGDLSRADVQATLVAALYGTRQHYQYRLGLTYLEPFARNLIPPSVWPGRPVYPAKTVAGAELLREGLPVVGSGMPSRVYGLAGEAMLNFGPALAPVVFCLLGVLLGAFQAYFQRLPQEDARWLLYPFGALFLSLALVSDVDNLLTLAIGKGLVPALLLLAASRASGRPQLRPVTRPGLRRAQHESRPPKST
jgi:hypothetical protein